MRQLKADAFYAASTDLAMVTSWIAATTQAHKDEQERLFHESRKLEEEHRQFIIERLTRLREHIEALGARVTLLALKEAQESITRTGATWGHAESPWQRTLPACRRLAILSGRLPSRAADVLRAG